MSSQKGNVGRTRPQKHRNRTAFKNNLHDNSNRIKIINAIQVSDVCIRCKEIIEWKIKYKKYKPLSQPKTCVKCAQKTVKQAYHVMCKDCGKKLGICTKCCESKDIIDAGPDEKEEVILDNEIKDLIQSLPERKRRTFMRYINQKRKEGNGNDGGDDDNKRDDFITKLNALKLSSKDRFDSESEDEYLEGSESD